MLYLFYYCIKEDNNCPKRNECKRYLDSDSHNCRSTLYKNSCTDDNHRILFIEVENASTDDGTKEDDSTEQTA